MEHRRSVEYYTEVCISLFLGMSAHIVHQIPYHGFILGPFRHAPIGQQPKNEEDGS